MTTACVKNEYFSGQGALLLATRNTVTGAAEGFRPVGNVSELMISVSTTEFEHRESCSGVRGLDLVLTQEINAAVSFTMESINRENLALTLYGSSSAVATASVTDESHTAFLGLWIALDNIKVSSVAVTHISGTPVYTLGTDYNVNLETGSVLPIAGGAILAAQELHIDYTYADQEDIQGVTFSAAPERYARFEGLNTADANKPVVVSLYRLSVAPLAELSLISDEVTQMVSESKLLADSFQLTGSQYFNIRKAV